MNKNSRLKFFQTKFGKRLIIVWAITVSLLIFGKITNLKRSSKVNYYADAPQLTIISPTEKPTPTSEIYVKEKQMEDGNIYRLEQSDIGSKVRLKVNGSPLWDQEINLKATNIYDIEDFIFEGSNNILFTIEKIENQKQLIMEYTVINNYVVANTLHSEEDGIIFMNLMKYYIPENILLVQAVYSDVGIATGYVGILKDKQMKKIKFCTGCSGTNDPGYVGFDGEGAYFINYVPSNISYPEYGKNRIRDVYRFNPVTGLNKVILTGTQLPKDAFGMEFYIKKDEFGEIIQNDRNLIIIFTENNGNWEYNLRTHKLAKTNKSLK